MIGLVRISIVLCIKIKALHQITHQFYGSSPSYQHLNLHQSRHHHHYFITSIFTFIVSFLLDEIELLGRRRQMMVTKWKRLKPSKVHQNRVKTCDFVAVSFVAILQRFFMFFDYAMDLDRRGWEKLQNPTILITMAAS